MDAQVFEAFQRLAYDHAGILLRENKASLLSARVAKRLRSLGLQDPSAYLDYLMADRSGQEMMEFLDAISTNFTSFYREHEHFSVLAAEAARWREQGLSRARIRCAASSTGEEPYTIAMTLAEALEGTSTDFRILASDLSLQVLRHAQRGVYERERIAPVPPLLRRKYFTAEGREADTYRVGEALRERVLFKRINLATPPFPFNGGLDAVFCRNVMIYFDTQVRQRLVREIERLLRPGGILFVAHSETLTGVSSGLTMLKPSIYRKVGP